MSWRWRRYLRRSLGWDAGGGVGAGGGGGCTMGCVSICGWYRWDLKEERLTAP